MQAALSNYAAHYEQEPECQTSCVETRLTQAVSKHPTVQAWRSATTTTEFRSVLYIEPDHRSDSLMASSLAGPRLFEVPPYVFANDKAGQLLAFYHLGSALSGHPNMLHGGIIAALLDECMGRACFPLLPHRIAVTAALNIKYRVPVELDSVIMVKAETERIDGRKAWVKAKMEDSTTGMLLVEADALFLEPRNANAFGRMM